MIGVDPTQMGGRLYPAAESLPRGRDRPKDRRNRPEWNEATPEGREVRSDRNRHSEVRILNLMGISRKRRQGAARQRRHSEQLTPLSARPGGS